MVTRQDALNYTLALKAVFVENQLAPLLGTIDPDVQSVSYDAVKNSDKSDVISEMVTVTFRNGGTKKADVCGDSYSALVKDVLKLF